MADQPRVLLQVRQVHRVSSPLGGGAAELEELRRRLASHGQALHEGRLAKQHAIELAVRRDRVDDPADEELGAAAVADLESDLDSFAHLVHQAGQPALDQRRDDRFLVGEELVDAADAHAGPLGDVIGGHRAVVAFAQKPSTAFEDGVDGLLGALLPRCFSRFRIGHANPSIPELLLGLYC